MLAELCKGAQLQCCGSTDTIRARLRRACAQGQRSHLLRAQRGHVQLALVQPILAALPCPPCLAGLTGIPNVPLRALTGVGRQEAPPVAAARLRRVTNARATGRGARATGQRAVCGARDVCGCLADDPRLARLARAIAALGGDADDWVVHAVARAARDRQQELAADRALVCHDAAASALVDVRDRVKPDRDLHRAHRSHCRWLSYNTLQDCELPRLMHRKPRAAGHGDVHPLHRCGGQAQSRLRNLPGQIAAAVTTTTMGFLYQWKGSIRSLCQVDLTLLHCKRPQQTHLPAFLHVIPHCSHMHIVARIAQQLDNQICQVALQLRGILRAANALQQAAPPLRGAARQSAGQLCATFVTCMTGGQLGSRACLLLMLLTT